MSEMFDRLAKTVAGGVSRRDAMKYLGGFLAGGFLAVLPGRARADDDDNGGNDKNGDEINEQCHKTCADCKKKRGSAFGRCMAACKICSNKGGKLCGTCKDVNAAVTCCLGAATCCAATSTASAYCANQQMDVNNCGACGKVCTGTTPACCSGICADLDSDAKNCGKCGNACASGKTCTKGVCG